jgi:hypothetical protein
MDPDSRPPEKVQFSAFLESQEILKSIWEVAMRDHNSLPPAGHYNAGFAAWGAELALFGRHGRVKAALVETLIETHEAGHDLGDLFAQTAVVAGIFAAPMTVEQSVRNSGDDRGFAAQLRRGSEKKPLVEDTQETVFATGVHLIKLRPRETGQNESGFTSYQA